MSGVGTIFRRELLAYFTTPMAYAFTIVFVLLASALTFQPGDFFGHGQADLEIFFSFHPWLYLFLVPAVTMRLWAEERRSGTIELLLTLPVSPAQAVLGKYLAAWAFLGIALGLTFPLWLTVLYLGTPDNGVIAASYLGSFLLAGALLAAGSAMSALAKSQLVAFVLAAMLCALLIAAGLPAVTEPVAALSPGLAAAIAHLGVLDHFRAVTRGLLDLRDMLYFGSTIVFYLVLNTILVDAGKAD